MEKDKPHKMTMDTLLNFDNLLEALEQYQTAFRNALQDSYIIDDRLASGRLLNSVELEDIQIDGHTYTVSLRLADYWAYMEYGVNGNEKDRQSPFSYRDKMPPVSKILEWVKVKPVLPKRDKNNRLPTPSGLAYVIAKSIQRKGIEGTHNMRKTAEEINDEWIPKISEAVTKDLSKSVGLIIREGLNIED